MSTVYNTFYSFYLIHHVVFSRSTNKKLQSVYFLCRLTLMAARRGNLLTSVFLGSAFLFMLFCQWNVPQNEKGASAAPLPAGVVHLYSTGKSQIEQALP